MTTAQNPSIEDTVLQPKKRVHVETWGCQMNVADSESMVSLLKKSDYESTESAEDADLIILNTCHIREKAMHKVVSRLGTIKKLKNINPNLQIAVSGCVPQMEHKKIMKSAPYVDVMLGPGQLHQLPDLLQKNRSSGKLASAFGFKLDPENPPQESTAEQKIEEAKNRPVVDGKNTISRFVNIAQGCDNFCTFCVVPFTRGREVSRMPEDILLECQGLVANGAKEITLLGQNVNSYGTDLASLNKISSSSDGPFVDLLRAVEKIPLLQRIRFTTSNPHDFTPELARLYGEAKKLGKYLHLPVQSGSDRILEVMKRKVTVQEYLERIDLLRSYVPSIALSTDLIVGFPSETDDDFQGTVQLVEKIRYHFIFAFAYSPRRGTAAARFAEQIPEEIKFKRLAHLNQIQNRISVELHEESIGQEAEVLFLYASPKEPHTYYGRDEHFRLVKCFSEISLIGKLAMVQVSHAIKTSLTAKLTAIL